MHVKGGFRSCWSPKSHAELTKTYSQITLEDSKNLYNVLKKINMQSYQSQISSSRSLLKIAQNNYSSLLEVMLGYLLVN